jgi:hypothetical protein
MWFAVLVCCAVANQLLHILYAVGPGSVWMVGLTLLL